MGSKRNGKPKGPRMISEIIRLREAGLSRRAIARALNCSRNTVDKYLEVSTQTVVTAASSYRAPWSSQLDWDHVRKLAQVEGEPLSDVWERCAKSGAVAVPYVSFWREFKRRYPSVPLEMHKIHPPAERVEIDYKGQDEGFGYFDRIAAVWVPCRLFGAVLCFSQMFYARATHTERQEDLLTSVALAYEYFGGVPLTTAFDNAKAAVTKAHRYDPDINPEFAMFCEHFSTAPLAMRPGKPKDKNLIENALGVFWRWARRKLLKRRYYSLAELNQALHALIDEFNDRVQRKYGVSRRQKFLGGEKDRLLPMPQRSWNHGEWKSPTVHPDCHVQIDYNFYSVPHNFRGKIVNARVGSALIEIFSSNECVARHHRLAGSMRGRYSTKKEHLPPSQLAILETTPQSVIRDAKKIGPCTGQMITQIIEGAAHPLRYLRRCQGILRLIKDFSPEAIEHVSALLISMNQSTATYDDYKKLLLNKDRQNTLANAVTTRSKKAFLRGQTSWSH
jgi:transposase